MHLKTKTNRLKLVVLPIFFRIIFIGSDSPFTDKFQVKIIIICFLGDSGTTHRLRV